MGDHACRPPGPANIISVVDAPPAVSSERSPTRPLCAVNCMEMPAAFPVVVNRRPRLRDVNLNRAGFFQRAHYVTPTTMAGASCLR